MCATDPSVDLCNMGLTDEDVIEVAGILKNNKTVRALNLGKQVKTTHHAITARVTINHVITTRVNPSTT
jgi:hypothetical protein